MGAGAGDQRWGGGGNRSPRSGAALLPGSQVVSKKDLESCLLTFDQPNTPGGLSLQPQERS